MIRDLDTSLIRTFVMTADKASMTAAANALHLTQGAVSQQVKRLEDVLGQRLFERDRRRLKLTRSGERLLDKARRLLQLNDEILAEIRGGAVAGQVRIGVPYDLVGTLLAPVLKAYAEAYPQVEISLVCASSPELAAALAAGTIDLAVIEERVGPSAGECLLVDRLVWVGARGGSARLKRPLPVSIVADTCAFRPAVLAALAEHGLDWRTVFENGNIDATTATVRSDLAVT
ncbi:MAG: LysR family transcriptional regulator, partial [Mesorhizobium sp.]